MKRTSKSISITLILAIMLLACLLLQVVGKTSAWFTDGGEGGDKVQITINVAGIGVQIYQFDGENDVEIDPNDETKQSYINLNVGEIAPEQSVDVNLKLGTSEPAGVYVRYQFLVYALGQEEPINTTDTLDEIKNNADTSDVDESKYEFVYQGTDKYYYFRDNTGKQAKLTRGFGHVSIMQSFKISEDNFANLNGETIKIVVNVECSDVEFGSQSGN